MTHRTQITKASEVGDGRSQRHSGGSTPPGRSNNKNTLCLRASVVKNNE